jgi:hypothetical protein
MYNEVSKRFNWPVEQILIRYQGDLVNREHNIERVEEILEWNF